MNARDADALRRLLTPDVLGDISRKDQGTSGSGMGYEILNGFRKVLGFLKQQWSLGRMLSYSRVTPVSGGGYVIGLVARYEDGTKQTFVDTKFAYSCSGGAIEHFLQLASAPAR
jgi:hypothetical protein